MTIWEIETGPRIVPVGMRTLLVAVAALPCASAFLANGPLARPAVAAQATPIIRMDASFTKKDDLLLEEEIDRRCQSRGNSSLIIVSL